MSALALAIHWYFITRVYCPRCDRSDEYRERRFTPKPTEYTDRSEYKEQWCGGCL